MITMDRYKNALTRMRDNSLELAKQRERNIVNTTNYFYFRHNYTLPPSHHVQTNGLC